MKKLNPNHKVVRQADGQWHKIAALIMVKLGLIEVALTMEDVNKLSSGNVNIVLDARGESETGILTVRIVDDKTAEELARKEGGRACDS
jgi:aminopeptidase C